MLIAVMDADGNSIAGEVDETPAGVDPQNYSRMLPNRSFHPPPQPVIGKAKGIVTLTATCAWNTH
jgi:hypothetical protein